MANFLSRENRTNGDAAAVETLNNGQVMFVGLTDRLFGFKKVAYLRWQVVVAEITADGKVARLVKQPFFSLEKAAVDFVDVETKARKNHSGAVMEYISDRVRIESFNKKDTTWRFTLLPAFKDQVLSLTSDLVRVKRTDGKIGNKVVYTVNRAKMANGTDKTLSIDSIREQIKSLADAMHMRIVLADDSEICPEYAITEKDRQALQDALDGKVPGDEAKTEEKPAAETSAAPATPF